MKEIENLSLSDNGSTCNDITFYRKHKENLTNRLETIQKIQITRKENSVHAIIITAQNYRTKYSMSTWT